MTYKINNICCIGAGYVGGPTMAMIADKCENINVEVVDLDRERIDKWNDSNFENLPVYEPGLAEIVKRCRGRNLHFSTLVKEKIKTADMIFISVNTPTKKTGLGAGKASDLKWVEACSREVATFSEGHTIVVEKSTIPVRTAEVIKSILEASTQKEPSNKTFDVLSNPEFLAEGSAVKDLTDPDRILIGGDNEDAIEALVNIYKNWVPKEKILKTNIWSSELAKLTANAFLAQRISSINSISALCEATGADIKEVSRAIGTDNRIGPRFLDSGPGFGGSCFKKDILNLVYLAEFFGLLEVANFWEGVVEINNWHQKRIARLIVKKLFGTVSGKKLCILGFAFKANTNDTRESAAISICRELLLEGANLSIYDPKVKSKQIEKELGIKEGEVSNNLEMDGYWHFFNSIDLCANSSDAIIIMTEWEEFKFIDWEKLSQMMRKPAWVFDTRSFIDLSKAESFGLNIWSTGRGN